MEKETLEEAAERIYPDNEFPFSTDIGSWKQMKRIKILD